MLPGRRVALGANRFLLGLFSSSYLETLANESSFWRCLAESLLPLCFYGVNVTATRMTVNATLVLSFISGLPGGAKKLHNSFKNLAYGIHTCKSASFLH